MTGPATAPQTRLWTQDGFKDDDWTHGETAEALTGNRRVILPLKIFLELDDQTRAAERERIGVALAPGEALDAIVPYLADLPLVALAFPAFNDGRSFSKAELLRGRHGYKGTVRAFGQVLVDQLPHMLRVGFDAFEVSHPVLLRRLEAGQTGGLPLYYQPTVAGDQVKGKYAWRRTPG